MDIQRITFKNISVDEDMGAFQIKLNSYDCSTTVEFYGYAHEFTRLGEELAAFPQTLESVVLYESGKNDLGQISYCSLKFFCYERNGHSAIQIVTQNRKVAPYTINSEFYILTVPASINKLGNMLKSWNPLVDRSLAWEAE